MGGDGHADDRARTATTTTPPSRSATPARASPTTSRARIFEPFFTTKPIGHGTGLGLDIAWRIVVNKHRGYLKVASEPGNTAFRVRLPLEGPQIGRDDLEPGPDWHRHVGARAGMGDTVPPCE